VVSISGVSSPLVPQLWLFLLADSGSMKSMTFREVLKWSGLRKDELIWNLNSVAGPAVFVSELAENNRRLAVIEEAGEFRKKMTSAQGPLAELASYFLMLYDHEDIKRATKRECAEIKAPAVNILGFSVPEPFIAGITAEEMVSGYMQRHSIIFAEPANRKRHPIIQLNMARTQKDWRKLIESIQHTTYRVEKAAIRSFGRAYERLTAGVADVPESFTLRIMWTCHTYALLYHILLGDGKKAEISTHAYGYAERLTRRSLSDMVKAFGLTLHSETYKKILRTEALKQRLGSVTVRDIYRNLHNIKHGEAEYLLKIVNNQG